MKIMYMGMGAALAVLAMTGVASAGSTVTLCGGREGGTYDKVMQEIGSQLERAGNEVINLNLDGSDAILTGLIKGQCDYGPVQKDVYYLRAKQSGDVAKAVPEAILYPEIVTLVCTKESGIDELSDLTSKNKVIIDTAGSGSSLTWETMVQIENELGNKSSWASATPLYTPLDEAGASMSLGDAQCAIGVGSNPIGWASALEKQGFQVGWVYDKNLNDLVFNGQPLYAPVDVPAGTYSHKFYTYKIPSVLFKSAAFKDNDVDRLVKRLAPSIGGKWNTVQ